MLENMIKKVMANDYIRVVNDNNESMGSYKGHLLLDVTTKKIVCVVEHEVGLVGVINNDGKSVIINGGVIAGKSKDGTFLSSKKYIVLSKEKILIEKIENYKGEDVA